MSLVCKLLIYLMVILLLRNLLNKAMECKFDKAHYLSMPLEEKRKHYACGNSYKTLSDIETWGQYSRGVVGDSHEIDSDIKDKVSIFVGNITELEVDAIVNAANERLVEGGGVDRAIHSAAGREMLRSECQTLNGCPKGTSKITGAYKLPSKYIIHTVGPIGEDSHLLKGCYWSSLELMAETGLKSIAFPCISTGVYGYPNEAAAHVAIGTIREWLEKSPYAKHTKRIIFCLFDQKDVDIYYNLMPQYFSVNRL